MQELQKHRFEEKINMQGIKLAIQDFQMKMIFGPPGVAGPQIMATKLKMKLMERVAFTKSLPHQ